MIAATDLRIGNVLICKKELCVVSEIYIDSFWVDDVNTMLNYSSNQQHILPIKLTPEILEKIGLTKQSDYYVFQTFNNYVSCVELLDVGTGFQVFDTSGVKMCLLEYLHELQNMYKCFTKQELPIDINTLSI